jgi:hypothetical protein
MLDQADDERKRRQEMRDGHGISPAEHKTRQRIRSLLHGALSSVRMDAIHAIEDAIMASHEPGRFTFDPDVQTGDGDTLCACGHGESFHRHLDECRFEDCSCRRFQ